MIKPKMIIILFFVVITIFYAFTIEKDSLDLTLLLDGMEDYSLNGEILVVEGSVIKFPLIRSLATGTVSIREKVWKISRYENQNPVISLHFQNGGVLNIIHLSDATNYVLTIGDSSGRNYTYTAIPVE